MMPDESAIQCEVCGTLYSNTEEVCPYCGEPQPIHEDYDETYDEAVVFEAVDEQTGYLGPEEHRLPNEAALYPQHYEDEALYEDELYPDDEGYDEEDSPTYDLESAYFPHETLAEPYIDDQIFGEDEQNYARTLYDRDDQAVLEDLEDEEEFGDNDIARWRFGWRRLLLGCMGVLICVSTFYGGIAVLAAYQGLRERTADRVAEAQIHYERGQLNLDNGEIELAIAELEHALRLNPNLTDARTALREATSLAASQPTPTSETRLAAATDLLERAEALVDEEEWAEALETLSQVRDLNPEYELEQVSALLYQVNYELGLESIDPETILDALIYFEQALTEAPGDSDATSERTKISLYIDGSAALDQDDAEASVEAFQQLYHEDSNYLDVEALLVKAYEGYGDHLVTDEAWCLAQEQYGEAIALNPQDRLLQTKADDAGDRCSESPTSSITPSPQSRQPASAGTASIGENEDATATTSTPAASSDSTTTLTGGSIYYSLYNFNETEWQILASPANGNGSSRVVVTNGTMPAVSANGQLLVYRSEAIESEGFHVYDLTSGEDRRVTIRRQDILPRWGGGTISFIFSAQEPATNRWRVQQGFADGRSDPQILRDGRTPTLSPDNNLIAYQGTDAEGNNPGIYVVPFSGGPEARLTTHESDRAPAFSPNSSQIAYMSTQNGSWDIFTVNLEGGTPRRVTSTSSNDGLPSWSPDGTKLAYVSDQGGSWGIYVISVSGGEPTKVAPWDGNQREDWLLSQIWWAK